MEERGEEDRERRGEERKFATKAPGLVYEWHIMESYLSAKANVSL